MIFVVYIISTQGSIFFCNFYLLFYLSDSILLCVLISFFLKKNDSSLKKKEKKEIDLDYLITEFIGI